MQTVFTVLLHVSLIVVVIVGGLKLLALLVTGDSRLFPKD